MSTLTLVRHGQALPFQGKDAALTATGEAQAVKLAEFWLRRSVEFDEVCCGTLPRQMRTQQIVGECFRAAGKPWPEAVTDVSWNEYDAPGVLHGTVIPPDARDFQRMFEAAMLAWLERVAEADGVESWPSFRSRVSAALGRIMEGPPSRRVAVFTSGGPIGFTVHCAMHAPPRSFLDVNWRVRNTSLTQFIFDRTRLTLDSFNSFPHLDDASLWTYR